VRHQPREPDILQRLIRLDRVVGLPLREFARAARPKVAIEFANRLA
jgi:hypothetical protein